MGGGGLPDAFGTATYWERVAESRWGAYISDVEKRAILKAHDLRGSPSTMLEIGAEGGRWSEMLSELGWRTACTDVDEQAMAACQQRIPTAECNVVGAEDDALPCVSDSVDLLLCIEVPPVMHADWFLGEANRVLREEGLVVAVCFNRLSLRGTLVHLKARITGSYDYYQLSYPAWRRLLKHNGYAVVHQEGYCWFPFRRASDSALVPWFVSFERLLGLRRLPSLSPWVVFIARRLRDTATIA